jgi:4-amino-4-deoxy-L-arabinose transferase-like glycosyltransferase
MQPFLPLAGFHQDMTRFMEKGIREEHESVISLLFLRGRVEFRNQAVSLLALLVLSGTLFFFQLGTPGLFDADEPAYAQAAREMLDSGDWITPHFNGRPRFDKPILFYWLTMLSYSFFGISEFAVRFWSALAAVVLVLAIARAARRWLEPPADLLAGLAFTLNVLTALLARAAVTDMLLTLFVTLAVLSGVEALTGPPERDGGPATFMWIAMALAVLVKGPIGIVVPAIALGGMLVIFREARSGAQRLVPWQGLVLFALITLPWYALVLAANGWAFIEGFVIKHHVSRYTGVISSHAGPIWFYFPVVLIGFFPWSGFAVRALWRVGTVVRGRSPRSPADRLLVACVCWVAGVFVFFSLAGTKLPSYLFPMFPGMAILAGASAVSSARVPPWVDRLTLWVLGLTGLVLAIGFGAAPWIVEAARARAAGILDDVAFPAGLAWWLCALLGLGTVAALAVRESRRVPVLAAMMVLMILTAEAKVAPQAYAILQGPLREFTEDARRTLGRQGTLIAYGLNAPTIVFYADHPVIPLGAGSPEGVREIRRLVETGQPVVVITRQAHIARLDGIPGFVRVKVRGGYAMYSSAPRAGTGSQEEKR